MAVVGEDKRATGRPVKSLQRHIEDGSFERRKHQLLLETDELVDDRALRKLQQRYRRLKTDAKRVEIALQFERVSRGEAPARAEEAATDFETRLRKLGRRGTAELAVNFFEEFYIWDDGEPWRLDPHQKEILHEIFRRDRARRRIYKEILLGLCRGQGKTPLASGLGTLGLATAPGRPKVFQIAGSKLQASIGTEYATNWVDDSDLRKWLRAEAKSVTRRDGRGSYTVLSSDGRLGHGRKPTIGIADELWLFRTAAEVQAYVALESALHKIQDSYLLGISTAGYDKRSLLGRKYKRGLACPKVETRREGFLTIGRDVEAGFLMWWYGMPEGYELDLENDEAVMRALKLANPGSWTDHREMLRSLHRAQNGDAEDDDDIQDQQEWLRLCLNYWTAARGSWLKPGAWRALADAELEIPERADVYVAVDAAHSYDTTAVSWSWLSPDGLVVTRCRIFSVRPAVPAHVYVDEFYDASGERHVAERFIQEKLAGRYRVREVVGDPNYFGGELARLGKRFLTAPIFPQSNEMRDYVQRFYRDVHGRRIATDGDRIVTAHIEAIAGQKTSDGYWAIRKLQQSEPMDGGTATIISVGRAQVDRRDVSIYQERDLVAVDDESTGKRDETDEQREARVWRKLNQDESAFEWPDPNADLDEENDAAADVDVDEDEDEEAW